MLLGNTLKRHRRFTYRTLTVYGRPSQIIRLHLCFLTLRPGSGQIRRVPQPRTRNARRLEHVPGLASSAFAHHYSRNHTCFLFLRVLRCFTSPRSHQPVYTFNGRRHPMTSAGLPHSETPGSKSGCRLPEAYRRLPRPSSAPDAKASTVRPQKLEHTKQSEETAKPKENTKQPPPRKEGSHRSLSVKRCSRPLYSSQTTTSTRPQPPKRETSDKPGNPEDPNQHPHRENPAGVPTARFLRTQQRVHPTPGHLQHVPTPLTGEGRY